MDKSSGKRTPRSRCSTTSAPATYAAQLRSGSRRNSARAASYGSGCPPGACKASRVAWAGEWQI